MKKLGFLITSRGWGGLEMNTLKLASWLAGRGYDITVFARRPSKLYAEAANYPAALREVDYRWRHFDFPAAKKLAGELRAAGIGTLLVFDNKDISLAFLLKKFYYNDLKVVYQQHMQLGIDKKDLFHTLRFSCLDRWIAPSRYLADEVARRTRFPAAKVSVIPLGVELDRFASPRWSRQAARRELNISEDALLLGVIGRISGKKGQYFLARSVPRLAAAGIEAQLLVFGSPTVNDPEDNRNYALIKEFVKDGKLEGKIHFREHEKDVSLFYSAVDVCVMASHGETYGMVTIEAMLSGAPLIATDSVGTPEMIDHGRYGRLYKYNDFESFRTALAALLKEKDLTRDMAEKARAFAAGKFSHVKECDQIAALLESLQAAAKDEERR